VSPAWTAQQGVDLQRLQVLRIELSLGRPRQLVWRVSMVCSEMLRRSRIFEPEAECDGEKATTAMC